MPRKQERRVKTPADRSPKAHMAPPPRETEPHTPAQPRGSRETGEFTDRGRPSLMKK